MMKRLLLLVCLFVCLWTFVACQQHTSYTIHGDISNLLKNDESIVGVDSIFLVVDEVAIGTRLTDGIFEFKGEVEEPVLAELRVKVKIVGGIRTNSISLILEPGHAIVKVNEKGGIEVSGTPLNDSFRDAIQRYVKKRQEGKTDEVKQLIREYCVAHKEDETAVLMLLVAPNVLEETEILKLIEQ
jgi:hypothetical protein